MSFVKLTITPQPGDFVFKLRLVVLTSGNFLLYCEQATLVIICQIRPNKAFTYNPTHILDKFNYQSAKTSLSSKTKVQLWQLTSLTIFPDLWKLTNLLKKSNQIRDSHQTAFAVTLKINKEGERVVYRSGNCSSYMGRPELFKVLRSAQPRNIYNITHTKMEVSAVYLPTRVSKIFPRLPLLVSTLLTTPELAELLGCRSLTSLKVASYWAHSS